MRIECATCIAMNRQSILFLLGVSLSVLGFGPTPTATAAQTMPTIIMWPREASWMEQLAAREVRRYVYLRTGRLLPMMTQPAGLFPTGNLIVVGRKDRPLIYSSVFGPMSSLGPQSYWLKTITLERSGPAGAQKLMVIGGDDAGVLYAAYALAEALGVRFYLHGDVIPDERTEWKVPVLDQQGQPLFALRGIQPFHDFPEGPDWWNRDDYLDRKS